MSQDESLSGQLPLPFTKFERYDFDQFCPGANAQVVEYLSRLITGLEHQPVLVWGDKSTGKSHLLQAACTQATILNIKVAYIPLKQHATLSPGMLDGMEQMDILCIDDLHEISGMAQWELAVFNLFNRMHDADKPMIFTANTGPGGIPISLADLKSRLSWGLIFHLNPLNEDDRFRILRQRAELRGLVLSGEVITYLARRVPRDMNTLMKFLDELDEAALVAKKKLTIPFVRELLERSGK